MNHWPDIDRCRALKKVKYPQGKTIFNYVCVGESWIIDLTKKGDGLQRCAAPIVTELVEEIEKFCTLENVDVPEVEMFSIWKTRKPLSPAVVWTAGSFAQWKYDENAEYSRADTLPNALADLWLWLRGREK